MTFSYTHVSHLDRPELNSAISMVNTSKVKFEKVEAAPSAFTRVAKRILLGVTVEVEEPARITVERPKA